MKRISNRILTFGTITAFAVSPVFVAVAMTKGKKPESEQLKALHFEKHELETSTNKKVNEYNVLQNQTKELEKKIEAMQKESGLKVKKIEGEIEATKKDISKLHGEVTSLEHELDAAKKIFNQYESIRNFANKKTEEQCNEGIHLNVDQVNDLKKINEKYEAAKRKYDELNEKVNKIKSTIDQKQKAIKSLEKDKQDILDKIEFLKVKWTKIKKQFQSMLKK
ncbi:hypothetical protein ACQRBB_03415 [Mycoplasmopsis bovis]|uniref:hypothetical protein n=1 Tax=Mycoplasmopsis bovis TaxID=28903 RepID=UPI003D0593F8